MVTYDKNGSQMISMVISLLCMSRQVIKIRFHNVFNDVESIWHGTLKHSANIFQAKREFSIGEGPPWKSESRLVLVWWDYFDLIIAEESIHKWKYDTPCIVVDNLINVQGGEVVFRTSQVQILKINANPNSTLVFIDRDYVGHPFSQRHRVNETGLKKLLNLFLNVCCFPWMYLT